MDAWRRNTFLPLYQQSDSPYGETDEGLEQWIVEMSQADRFRLVIGAEQIDISLPFTPIVLKDTE